MIIKKAPKENKTRLAKKLGISRSALYYEHKQPVIDEGIRNEILEALTKHPAYGHKRIALNLKRNKKQILRVMKKFGIKPYRRRKTPRKTEDEGKAEAPFLNLIETFCPIQPNVVWVGDFTWIEFHGVFYYLATVMDLFTREIIGWSFSNHHSTSLVIEAFDDAEKKTGNKPVYFHCDQGSEYDSAQYIDLLKMQRIIVSMSRKSHPWENRFQESFYSHFKLELGDPERFETLGELVESIAHAIYYYNHDRIHTSLKMSPVQFKEKSVLLNREYLFKEMGT